MSIVACNKAMSFVQLYGQIELLNTFLDTGTHIPDPDHHFPLSNASGLLILTKCVQHGFQLCYTNSRIFLKYRVTVSNIFNIGTGVGYVTDTGTQFIHPDSLNFMIFEE